MKIKTQDLIGPALDWAVAISNGIPPEELYVQSWGKYAQPSLYRRNRDENGKLDGTYTTGPDLLFSRKWEAGGPLIEREGISTIFVSGDLGEPKSYWVATANRQAWQYGYGPYHEQDEERSLQIHKSECPFFGPTPLVAAMRCYVASKLGDEVDIPDELAP